MGKRKSKVPQTKQDVKSSYIERTPLLVALVAVVAAVLLYLSQYNDPNYNSVGSPVLSSDHESHQNLSSLKGNTLRIVSTFPHDKQAFTQGLLYHNGELIESTGLWEGKSSLRKVDLESGEVLQTVQLPDPKLFGEGLALRKGKLYQLTYKSKKVFVYDVETLSHLHTFEFESTTGEGWGLVYDPSLDEFIHSDGSSVLQFIEPDNFTETRRVFVNFNGNALSHINELEYVHGEVWANVFTTTVVARINPSNGEVIGLLHFDKILPKPQHPSADVFNGIALLPPSYTGHKNQLALAVTGKRWESLFVVTIDL